MRKVIRWIGNTLIVVSLLLISYIYYPIVSLYLNPPKAPPQIVSGNTIPSGFHIYIPKISAYAEVIPNVDPWHASIYLPALKKGVAQAAGTALPGQNGTIFLFAHSSLPPWEITHTNIPFLKLGELKQGDTITIFYNNKKYQYEVDHSVTVWPNQTQYLTEVNQQQLILQTCTPLGTDLQRLLIFAYPV